MCRVLSLSFSLFVIVPPFAVRECTTLCLVKLLKMSLCIYMKLKQLFFFLSSFHFIKKRKRKCSSRQNRGTCIDIEMIFILFLSLSSSLFMHMFCSAFLFCSCCCCFLHLAARKLLSQIYYLKTNVTVED